MFDFADGFAELAADAKNVHHTVVPGRAITGHEVHEQSRLFGTSHGVHYYFGKHIGLDVALCSKDSQDLLPFSR